MIKVVNPVLRSTVSVSLIFVLSFVLTLGTAPLAQANHTGATLEVVAERQSVAFGVNSVQLTAIWGELRATPLSVDFENEDDLDGTTYASIDATCTIAVGTDRCSATITRDAGTDYWRVWADLDGVQGTTEADLEEGRISNPQTDCAHATEGDTAPACDEGPMGDQPNPGTGCVALLPSPLEPDCTDVVKITWSSGPGLASSMDCDDDGTPDTEREAAGSQDSVTYTCNAYDANGTRLAVDVFGEVENEVNDPDPVDGPSYDDPDFRCAATVQPITNEAQPCAAQVSQAENEFGTAEICWWVALPEEGRGVGATRCAGETTEEGQAVSGADAAHSDLADQTEITWSDPSTLRLDCSPETGTERVGSAHTVTCAATSGVQPVAGTRVDAEASGVNDPDSNNILLDPDFSCTTASNGECSFIHGAGGSGTTTNTGVTIYRAWIDIDNSNATSEADVSEGNNEQASPGESSEPDDTDVMSAEWLPAPNSVSIQPESDNDDVGNCNPFTISVRSGQNPAPDVVVDVEQHHESSLTLPSNDEPTVEFCTPASGPNLSSVDTTKGDRGPNSTAGDKENPDNPGTAGGETTQRTDSQGQVTIGIRVIPGQGSNGSGTVNIVAWFDGGDNDDPEASEPKDTATKTWAAPAGVGGRALDCTPETATTEVEEARTFTCTVTNSSLQPESGVDVSWTETGSGQFTTSTQTTTNAQGQVSATVASDEDGSQTITATLTNSLQGEPDTDECQRQSNDPPGASAGKCSDSMANSWQGAEPDPECSDEDDNDGDGDVDLADDGCSSADDDDESDDPEPPPKCPGFESDLRNQVVGTEGDDALEGTEGDDIICGLGGNDAIDALGGNDLVIGGEGDDVLSGADGQDLIDGGGGVDEISGAASRDVISGGPGNDTIRGGSGTDEIESEGGRDAVWGDGGGDFINGGGGNDTLRGAGGDDNLKGAAGNDTLTGGRGKDRFDGGKGTDSCDAKGREKAKSCEKFDPKLVGPKAGPMMFAKDPSYPLTQIVILLLDLLLDRPRRVR